MAMDQNRYMKALERLARELEAARRVEVIIEAQEMLFAERGPYSMGASHARDSLLLAA